MEESFQLLSSMSPRIKGRQKTIKRAITVLATKKHFRRSSVHENLNPTVKNENLNVIDGSTDSASVISSSDKVNELTNKIQKVIVIDSSSDESEMSPQNHLKKLSKVAKNINMEESLDSRINQWLEDVQPVSQKDNLTLFSQVSTIFGDEDNLKLTNGGVAAHSTFCDHTSKRFDEFFSKETNKIKANGLHDIEEISGTSSDDSFMINKSLTSRLQGSKNGSKNKGSSMDKSLEISGTDKSYEFNLEELSENKVEIVSRKSDKTKRNISAKNLSAKSSHQHSSLSYEFNLEGSLDNRTKSSAISSKKLTDNSNINEKKSRKASSKLEEGYSTPKQLSRTIKGNLGVSIDDMDSIMSTLYGQEWSLKKDILTPKTAPQNQTKHKDSRQVVVPTTTERKKMPGLTENFSNNHTQKINLKKLHQPAKSPWMKRYKNVCDSDSEKSDSNSESKQNTVKTQLNFSDLDENKSDKENSYWGESLEDRIRKKMNNFKEPAKNTYNKKVQKDSKITNKAKPKKNVKKVNKSESLSSSESESNDVDESDVDSDREFDMEITRIVQTKKKSKRKEDGYTFLESLSSSVPLSKINITSKIYRTNYAQHRDSLARKLFDLYNERVFDSAIPSDSEILWNDRLRGTAGLCHCKKITHRDGKVERKIKISLSLKVLDSPDRLRDTLIHEMCHAATWIVNQVSNGHGAYWKAWAIKAMKTFPELPPIKRCHSYVVNTKYTYRCTQCGYSFGRHSRSLDLNKKCCGLCHGKFEILINKTTKQGETKSVLVTPRKEATGFALFVKENYALYKEPTKKHGDVMKILGQKFADLKVKK